jgi:hypothetical protein
MGEKLRQGLEAADGTVFLPVSSHAETALAGSLDSIIVLDVGVVEACINKSHFKLGRSKSSGGLNLDLVWNCWIEEGRHNASNGDQQERSEKRTCHDT